MKFWIDPPSGWQWGFPKIYDREVDGDDIQAWIIKEGYPQAEVDKLGEQFYFRSWEATDRPTDFRKGINTKKG